MAQAYCVKDKKKVAADAEKLKDRQHTMTQLSIAMNNCIACHAIYRFSDTGK